MRTVQANIIVTKYESGENFIGFTDTDLGYEEEEMEVLAEVYCNNELIGQVLCTSTLFFIAAYPEDRHTDKYYYEQDAFDDLYISAMRHAHRSS